MTVCITLFYWHLFGPMLLPSFTFFGLLGSWFTLLGSLTDQKTLSGTFQVKILILAERNTTVSFMSKMNITIVFEKQQQSPKVFLHILIPTLEIFRHLDNWFHKFRYSYIPWGITTVFQNILLEMHILICSILPFYNSLWLMFSALIISTNLHLPNILLFIFRSPWSNSRSKVKLKAVTWDQRDWGKRGWCWQTHASTCTHSLHSGCQVYGSAELFKRVDLSRTSVTSKYFYFIAATRHMAWGAYC